MKLNITVESTGQVLEIDISNSLTLEDFRAYIEAETDISPQNQILKHEGKILDDNKKTIEQLNINNEDLIVVLNKTSAGISNNPASSSSTNATETQIEFMRQQFLNDPEANRQLLISNPSLHSILNNPTKFKNAMFEQVQGLLRGGMPGMQSSANQEELKRLQQDPDSTENQQRILEIIREEQIEENMRLAYEITPESFTSVNMLYIDISINGHKVQAFVDSGAQSTIISPKLADEIGISRLIDKRFQGEARGVGSQRIQGKIHSVPIQIGDSKIDVPCSFIVLDTSVDLLFGLDMLRRHKCVVDLEKDVLVVGGHIKTRFLHESEIKNNAFGNNNSSTNNSGFGGNIFSDLVMPANSTGSSKNLLNGLSGDAAIKRQNTGKNNIPKYKEEDITKLISLGFSRDEAIKALTQTNGNVELAASLLFQ